MQILFNFPHSILHIFTKNCNDKNLLFSVLFIAISIAVQSQTKADPWVPFKSFIGEWTGQGGGEPGKQYEVYSKVLLKKAKPILKELSIPGNLNYLLYDSTPESRIERTNISRLNL